MKFATALLSLLIAATSVSAHATWQEFWDGSHDDAGSNVRLPQSNSPVTSVSSNDIACNANAHAASGKVTVAAGSQATVEMHQQPGDRSCSNEAIGGNHYGPVIVYLAKVDDALSAVGSSANWFKISQAGLVSGTSSNAYWGTMQLNDNCGKYVFTIPSCIAPGDYLVRAEAIALHAASSVGGAQFYMSCYAITVTGGGSTSPSTVKFPGAYSATDPGILFNLYGTYSSYTVPGPPVFTCSGGNTPPPSSSQGSPSSSTKSTSSSSSRSTSTSSTKTSSASGAGQTLYGQCGGQGWTGPTTCASGTCKSSSQYYSQCLP